MILRAGILNLVLFGQNVGVDECLNFGEPALRNVEDRHFSGFDETIVHFCHGFSYSPMTRAASSQIAAAVSSRSAVMAA